jgi:hypothetical protein
LEWQAEKDLLCKCGHPIYETYGPDEFDKWNAERDGTCDACRAQDRAARIANGVEDLNPLAGVRFRTWRDQPSTNGSG